MINVSWQQNRQGICGFDCIGHAGYAQDDEDDIICAAVTGLAAAILTAFTDVLELETDYDFRSGHLSVTLKTQPASAEAREKAGLLFKTFELGVRQIEMSYGSQYVHVEDMPI